MLYSAVRLLGKMSSLMYFLITKVLVVEISRLVAPILLLDVSFLRKDYTVLSWNLQHVLSPIPSDALALRLYLLLPPATKKEKFIPMVLYHKWKRKRRNSQFNNQGARSFLCGTQGKNNKRNFPRLLLVFRTKWPLTTDLCAATEHINAQFSFRKWLTEIPCITYLFFPFLLALSLLVTGFKCFLCAS